MKKLIRWFNDIKKGYIRLRFCEKCGILSYKVHWAKNDYVCRTFAGVTIYGHIWLCDRCFYNPILGLK